MPNLAVNTPLGVITLFEEDDAIVAIDWDRGAGDQETPLLAEAARQLREYFAGGRREFDLPLAPSGDAFQQAIFAEMLKIPYGESRTYGDLAKATGSAARAVGRACGSNPIAIVIPCHRVVGADGSLTGYSGAEGVETKLWLLRHEGERLL